VDHYRVQSNGGRIKGDRRERNGDSGWIYGDGWKLVGDSQTVAGGGISLVSSAHHFLKAVLGTWLLEPCESSN